MTSMTLIASTSKTPEVSYDLKNGIFQIRGKSIPENSRTFYEPIHLLLNKYLSTPAKKTTFTFKYEYCNSSTHVEIAHLLRSLEQLHTSGKQVVVYWLFEEGDDDMQEIGNTLKSITKTPFMMMSY